MRSAANVTVPGASGGGPGPRAPGDHEDLPVLLPPENSAQKSGGQKGTPHRGASWSGARSEWGRKRLQLPYTGTGLSPLSCFLKVVLSKRRERATLFCVNRTIPIVCGSPCVYRVTQTFMETCERKQKNVNVHRVLQEYSTGPITNLLLPASPTKTLPIEGF